MDAITMLKEDHKTVEQLFKRFEKAGDRAFAEKRKLADRIVEELSTHAAIEEQVFYPVARATVPDTEDVVLESLEEHHIVKWVLSELDGMDPAEERFDAKMTVLIENVRHHVEEEEQEFFPKVRAELDRNALAEVGQAMETAKQMAPSHPHPRSPDTPPGNLAAAAGAGMVDRIGDTVSGVAQGGVSAVQDLIALILGRRKRSGSPTGSKVARDTARDVRGGASQLTDDAVAAAVRAKRTATTAAAGAKKTATAAVAGTKDTARAASKGAKRTATTARRSAQQTATTAKRTSAKRTTTKRTSAKRNSAKRTSAKRAAGTKRSSATRTARSAAKKASTATNRTAKAAATA
jgi:hemerythrin-like domain-containing protein